MSVYQGSAPVGGVPGMGMPPNIANFPAPIPGVFQNTILNEATMSEAIDELFETQFGLIRQVLDLANSVVYKDCPYLDLSDPCCACVIKLTDTY